MQTHYSRGANGAFNPASDIVDGPPIPAGEPVYNQWDELFRTGHQFQNSFSASASGGTDKVTYYSSLSRLDQTGVLPNSEFDRTTLKVSTSLRASDKVRFDAAATYINSNGTNPRVGIGGAGAVSYGMRFSPEVPMQPFVNDLGLPDRYSTNIENPYYFAQNAFQTERVNRVIGSLGVNVQPAKWLEVDYRVGIDQYTDRRQRVASPRTLIGAGGNGSVEEQSFQNREINSNLLATARTTLAPDLNASLSLGNQLTFINSENLLGTGSNFVTPDFFSINNLTNYRVTLFPTRRNIFGVFADAKLDWRQTLYLNVTGRNDWASTLPANNRSFFYPSVSLGYVLRH